MQRPPNMGSDYTKRFAGIYPKLAKEYQAFLIPFLLENVATMPELNLEERNIPKPKGSIL